MADATTLTLFRLLCAEFATVSDNVVGQWLDFAAMGPAAAAFGSRWAEAVVWRAAHYMKKMGPGGNADSTAGGGPVTSKHAASRSISWAAPSFQSKTAEEAWYMTTSYGQAYLAVRGTRADAGPLLI